MKRRIPYILFLTLFTGIIISSCVKKPDYPSEPVIAYKDFLRYGKTSSPDSVELVLSFTDNEGDIGIDDQSDTGGVFNKGGNVYMVFFYWDTTGIDHWECLNSDLSQPPPPVTDTLMFAYSVPLVLAEGEKSQPMKGLIYVKIMDFYIFTSLHKIKFDVYMYDRAKHISNRITTPSFDF